MRSHWSRLVEMLRRSGIGSGDAEDIAQDALCILAGRLHEVPQRSQLAFLKGTARRMAADRRRTAWHRVVSHEPASIASLELSDGPHAHYQRREARLRVEALVEHLPDDERDVFNLAELECLSRSEIAHVLGVPSGTVASRLRRARAHFSTMLSACPAAIVPPRPRDDTRRIDDRRFETNAWGATKTWARFDQRLVQRTKSGESQWGWSWRWPGFEASVYAYPEVLIGWKPWSGGVPTDTRFPLSMAQARLLAVDYGVEMRATGSYNLALCAWLTHAKDWSLAPTPRTISTEVMVWLDYSPGLTPPGRCIETTKVGGEPYELWRAIGHGKADKGDDAGWTAITLRSVGGRPHGSVPLGELLDALIRRGLMEPSLFLSSVELGNEIMGGVGTTFVERFAIAPGTVKR